MLRATMYACVNPFWLLHSKTHTEISKNEQNSVIDHKAPRPITRDPVCGKIQTRNAIQQIVIKDGKELQVPRVGLHFESSDWEWRGRGGDVIRRLAVEQVGNSGATNNCFGQ